MNKCLPALAFFAITCFACNDNNKGDSKAPVATTSSVTPPMTDISASTDLNKLLCQDWENKEDAEDAALSGGTEGIETTYRGLSFFTDGSVVENPRDKIRFGKWSMSDADKTITIAFDKGAKANYRIVALGAKQMILMTPSDRKKTEYRADGKVHDNPADDPFHASNNLWRIKPTRAEADSAIKRRAEQCVLFYARFLADNAGREAATISFTGLPTCFKWYRGGVSVTNKSKLQPAWFNCFYNEQQGIKAHEMIEKIISKKYKWNKDEKRWVKQSADVVRQMYDTLKAL
jgi:hypothetical protein